MNSRTNLDELIEQLIKSNKFDQFLNEIEESLSIDTDVEITPASVQVKGEELFDVNVGDKKYELSLKEFLLSSKKSFIEINFRLKNYRELKKTTSSNYGVETGITGTGDAKKVFDKIVSTIVVLIKRKSPDYLTFQAREEKRQRLYRLMIRDVLRKINDYKISKISPITNDVVDESEFWLEKI